MEFFSYLILAFLAWVSSLLVLASVNTTLGIRKRYVQILLKIFEFGRLRIQKAEQRMFKRLGSIIEIEDKDRILGISHSVIKKEEVLVGPLPSQRACIPRNHSYNTLNREFELWYPADIVRAGVEAIIEDEVTKRFSAEELPSWNLLTRTNKNYSFISWRLSALWLIGWFLRYWILLPTRLFITIVGVVWLMLATAVVGFIPEGWFKRKLFWHVSLISFRILARSFSAVVTYHNKENKAKGGGICVANHTSPIDVVILACDGCYAMVGQKQGGFLGTLQRAMSRASSPIWFERFEMKDRASVVRRLKEHSENPKLLPILIFPEGTCINNTSVMMFKKGSFEVGGTIYPAAIKYDPRFGDPFWDSSKQGYMHYLLMMMSSWAIVCEIWYLPPMTRQEGESSIDFAKRVKSAIAQQGGLIDLEWDGQLKRVRVKKEWKELHQEEFSKKN